MSDPLQSLWANQPVPDFTMAPSELRTHVRRFQRRIRMRNAGEYFGSAVVIAAFSWYTISAPVLLIKIGSVLVVLAALYVAWKLATKARAASTDDALAAESCTGFHRAELVRQRDALASVWSWYLGPFIPGMLVFLAGIALTPELEAPPLARAILFGTGLLFVGGLFALIGALNWWVAKRLDREIAALDEATG